MALVTWNNNEGLWIWYNWWRNWLQLHPSAQYCLKLDDSAWSHVCACPYVSEAQAACPGGHTISCSERTGRSHLPSLSNAWRSCPRTVSLRNYVPRSADQRLLRTLFPGRGGHEHGRLLPLPSLWSLQSVTAKRVLAGAKPRFGEARISTVV